MGFNGDIPSDNGDELVKILRCVCRKMAALGKAETKK